MPSVGHQDLIVEAAAVVVPRGAQVLMLRRYPWDRSITGLCFPGGKLEPGETPREAAAREALEETGYLVRVGEHILAARRGPFLIHFFQAEIVGGELRGFPSPEHAEALWLQPSEALPEAASEATRAVLRWVEEQRAGEPDPDKGSGAGGPQRGAP